jgi:putative ABC transport system permease protein
VHVPDHDVPHRLQGAGCNKLRTGLTMLGMIIGVSAVITLVAMGNGASRRQRSIEAPART